VKGGVSPEPATTKWSNELKGRIRERLATYGFVGAERKHIGGDASRLVKPFFDAYIATRTDWKPPTRYKYGESAKYFSRFVGSQRLLSDVTPADVDAWRLWLVTSAIAAKGDKPALKNLLSKDVFDGFAGAIDSRLALGQRVESRFVGIDKAKIQQASLNGRKATITMEFVSELISATYDKAGEVIDGDPKEIRQVTDVWTFERDVGSRDPNWKLVATEAPA
jgi:hypothetical protein